MARTLKWIIAGLLALTGFLVILPSMYNLIPQKPQNHYLGKYHISEQFGLRGRDWEKEGLDCTVLDAEIGKIYYLPTSTIWADLIAGDTNLSAPVRKIWFNGTTPLTDTITYNLATILGGINLSLIQALEEGKLGVMLPKGEADFTGKGGFVTKGTLIIVTKSEK